MQRRGVWVPTALGRSFPTSPAPRVAAAFAVSVACVHDASWHGSGDVLKPRGTVLVPAPLCTHRLGGGLAQEQQNKQLEADVKAAEESLAAKEAALASVTGKLEGVQADLERTAKSLEEREAKVCP